MHPPNISLSSTDSIQEIEELFEEHELIDLQVENQHTFWVSNNDCDWTLTHNCGAPDIDTDISDRDKLLEQLRNFFGYENVVPISNYNCFALKTLVKDLGKFYGVSFEETNAATRTVEEDVRRATTKHGDDKNLFVLKYDDALGHSPSFRSFIERHPQVGESIKILFRQNRSLGRHAGGVLIADDLPKKMPLITSGGEPQSPWVEGVHHKHLEKIGSFIKYDILGLETLRIIERTIELIILDERMKRGWIEFELEDGTRKYLYGDQRVNTSNRGTIIARDVRHEDDIVSFDVPSV